MTAPRWVYAALAAYLIGFVVYWPQVLLIVDEDRYVTQAVAFAQGQLAMPDRGILYPAVSTPTISDYPPGTSLLQTPLVWLGGWRIAAALSVLSLFAATLATMRWLRANGGNEGFALIVPGFIGSAFFGRVAMSDVPATALVAVAGWLLWRARPDRPVTSVLAGFSAGVVLLFREPVILLLAPLAAGALVRRACAVRWTVAGFAVGAGIRLAVSAAVFGTPWYLRDPQIDFAFSSLAHTLPLYGLILLVLLPAGGCMPFFYRGARRPELTLGMALYVALFLLYDYDGVAMNGPAKGLVLASRFMAPAVPLLALMAADVWPRWWRRLVGERVSSATVAALAGMATAIAFAIHPVTRRQELEVLAIRDMLLAHTRAGVPVITNTDVTLKYLSPAYAARQLIVREALSRDSLVSFSRRHGTLSIALLDRIDSPVFRENARENAEFMAEVAHACELRETFTSDTATGRLRIFEVSACR